MTPSPSPSAVEASNTGRTTPLPFTGEGNTDGEGVGKDVKTIGTIYFIKLF